MAQCQPLTAFASVKSQSVTYQQLLLLSGLLCREELSDCRIHQELNQLIYVLTRVRRPEVRARNIRSLVPSLMAWTSSKGVELLHYTLTPLTLTQRTITTDECQVNLSPAGVG